MFTYKEWDGDSESTQYYDVVFTESIVIFSEGEVVSCLNLEATTPMGHYILQSLGAEGEILKSQEVKLTAVVPDPLGE